jgi:mRNA-degrading endonuclease RelE of RelBE toxin-antitoxin system
MPNIITGMVKSARYVLKATSSPRLNEPPMTSWPPNPDFGKPLRYGLKGEWSIYVKPYRLIYKVEDERLILLRFEHRKEVYG